MPRRRRSFWLVTIAEVVSAGIVTALLLMTVWTVGPYLESRLFPVAAKLSVVNMKSDPAGTKIESAVFTKLRDCQLTNLSWYYVNKDGVLSRVSVMPIRAIDDYPVFVNKPEGTHLVGPWIVGLRLRDVIYRSFARIEHRCHPFWMTVSDLYP